MATLWQHDHTWPVAGPMVRLASQLRIFAVGEAQRSEAAASIAAQAKALNATTLPVALLDAADYTFWKAEE